MNKYLPNLENTGRGAPMGRVERHEPPPAGTKVHIQLVKINAQGYDHGGAYWGIGLPLYQAAYDRPDMPDRPGVRYVRAIDWIAAYHHFRKDWSAGKYADLKRQRNLTAGVMNELKETVREFDLTTDPYGMAMEWLFDVSGVIHNRGGEVPEFSCPTRSADEGQYGEYLKDYSTPNLLRFQRLLSRYVDMLKRKGLDY